MTFYEGLRGPGGIEKTTGGGTSGDGGLQVCGGGGGGKLGGHDKRRSASLWVLLSGFLPYIGLWDSQEETLLYLSLFPF